MSMKCNWTLDMGKSDVQSDSGVLSSEDTEDSDPL